MYVGRSVIMTIWEFYELGLLKKYLYE